MKPEFKTRIQNLRRKLKECDLDAFVVLDRVNTVYFTGFHCSYSILIIDGRKARFVTDSRYAEMAEKALPGFEVNVIPRTRVKEYLVSLWKKGDYARAAFEGQIAVFEYEYLRKWTRGTKLVRAEELVNQLRLVKDERELKHIRKAVKLADQLMARAIDAMKPGIRETELSRLIRFGAEDGGGEGESFANIVAGGPNSSKPHHHPEARKLKVGDPVTIDLGVVYKGYCSDLTRTPVLGKVSPKFEKIYNVCLEANEAAIKAIRPGMTGIEVDAVARDVIEEAGFGEYFGHGLGHGVGLEIHEAPRLSPGAPKDYRLEAGNIVTIEPGIYIPGFGGVRIEDYVYLTKTGAKVLSRAPKDLMVIPASR